MATSAQGQKADADAKARGGEPEVTTDDSGVTVNRPDAGVEAFAPVKLYHRLGGEREATSLEQKIALEFDGYSATKPKSTKS